MIEIPSKFLLSYLTFNKWLKLLYNNKYICTRFTHTISVLYIIFIVVQITDSSHSIKTPTTSHQTRLPLSHMNKTGFGGLTVADFLKIGPEFPIPKGVFTIAAAIDPKQPHYNKFQVSRARFKARTALARQFCCASCHAILRVCDCDFLGRDS